MATAQAFKKWVVFADQGVMAVAPGQSKKTEKRFDAEVSQTDFEELVDSQEEYDLPPAFKSLWYGFLAGLGLAALFVYLQESKSPLTTQNPRFPASQEQKEP